VLVALAATGTGLNAWLNHLNKAFYDALLFKPDILFMDEASSALDNASEAALYQLIVDRLPDCTLVSIAHSTTLEVFHDKRLNLGTAGAVAVA
jgi:putative ATP-binding cassette transporter